MPRDRHGLHAVPDLTPDQRERLARAELAVLKTRITAGVQTARIPQSSRERWLRRVLHVIQSYRTTAR